MIALLELLGRLGVPTGMRRAVLGVLGILLVLAVLGTAKCHYDRKLIANHDNIVEREAAIADRKADTKAAEQRVEDQARLTQERQELKEVLNDPRNATELDRRRAFHLCLRMQQAARENGKQPPACL